MFIAPLEIVSKFVQYVVNKSPLTKECEPLSIVSIKPIKRQGGALNFKGLPQDGGWADFKKNLRASLSLINTYQMNLISAGSISLNTTF
jgi:hypothetical protein